MSAARPAGFRWLVLALFAAAAVPTVVGLLSAADFGEVRRQQVLEMVAEATRAATEARGLEPLAELKVEVTSKEQLRSVIRQKMAEPKTRRAMELAEKEMRAFGLIGGQVSLEDEMEELLVAEVAGYYDPRKGQLFVVDSVPGELLRPTLIHEIGHALQDQHFDLKRFDDLGPRCGDPQYAVQALFEGDATLIMMEVLLKTAEPGFRDAMLEQMDSIPIAALSENVNAPDFLLELMAFPYFRGLGFARAARSEAGWDGVNALFGEPPLSTEQIVQPDKRLGAQRDDPRLIEFALPAALAGDDWRVVGSDVAGQLTLRVILQEAVGLRFARKASLGWDGDRAVTLEHRADGGVLLPWVLVFDSERDAKEATEQLRQTKTPPLAIARRGDRVAGLWGTTGFDGAEAVVEELLQSATEREIGSWQAYLEALNNARPMPGQTDEPAKASDG